MVHTSAVTMTWRKAAGWTFLLTLPFPQFPPVNTWFIIQPTFSSFFYLLFHSELVGDKVYGITYYISTSNYVLLRTEVIKGENSELEKNRKKKFQSQLSCEILLMTASSVYQ